MMHWMRCGWGSMRKKVNWILDADIRGFFDNIVARMAGEVHRASRRATEGALRLIQKWLKAGVSEEGEWSETKVGTPQGAVISPLLANIYLHYVFDLWVSAVAEGTRPGDMIVVRYADDIVFGLRAPAGSGAVPGGTPEAVWRSSGWTLHPDKTRLIEFGRFAESNRPEAARRGKAGDLRLSGIHAHRCGTTSERAIGSWFKRTDGRKAAAHQTTRSARRS